MARTNQDGKDVKLVLEWLCRRRLPDGEMAAALDIPPTNYSRRKDDDGFPSFEELERFANHFGLDKRALQIAFGYLDRDALSLLDQDGMRQYVEQGGGETPFFTPRGRKMTMVQPTHETTTTTKRGRRQRRNDAPPGP